MTECNLAEGSKSYHEEANIYERFSAVEDTPGKILEYLTQKVAGKDVMDIGCGTGKYLAELAPLARTYIGLDISADQLNIAKQKSQKFSNVRYICSSAEIIDLPDKSIDTVISTWVFGTIKGIDRRAAALVEAQRVLRPQGRIYLIENDIGGEFEYIRGRYPDTSRTKEYNDWLEDMGFRAAARFSTYFEFSSMQEAKDIIGSIWGKDAEAKVKDKRIEHTIVIYEKML